MSILHNALLQNYPVDELLSLQEVRPDPLTIAWRAHVRCRQADEWWCIKAHRSQDAQRVVFETTFAARLHEQLDLLSAPPVVTRDGKLWFHLNDERFSASRWISSDPACDWLNAYDLSVERCAAAGAALADFHAAAARVASRLPSGWQDLCRPYLPHLNAEVTRLYDRALVELPVTDLLGSILSQSRQAVLTTCEQMMTRIEQLATSQPILVHGDYHPGNTLFQGDKLVAIIDFDYVHLNQAFYDLGYGAYMFARRAPAQCQDGLSLDARRLTAFVRAYEEQLSNGWLSGLLPAFDAEAMNVFLHLGAFLVAYWLLSVYLDEPDKRPFITLPLTQSLLDVSRTMEPWRGTLYI